MRELIDHLNGQYRRTSYNMLERSHDANHAFLGKLLVNPMVRPYIVPDCTPTPLAVS